tara:strand:+ start:600 stop:1298 length:699 start_codon:yes stop_codon:yes gene_type:complete
MRTSKKLSIIIPSLNEEYKLPLLIADIRRCNIPKEIVIVDCGSSDNTLLIARVTGCKSLKVKEPNRGHQLKVGASSSSGDWLLFLHADSRLEEGWFTKVHQIIDEAKSGDFAWFFKFRVSNRRPVFRLMETIVSIRSNLLKEPYGDQGLLISKKLYTEIGGYKSLHLMEDLDIVIRLNKTTRLKEIDAKIYTDSRKWRENNIIKQSISNALLRKRWLKGEASYEIHKEYYSK